MGWAQPYVMISLPPRARNACRFVSVAFAILPQRSRSGGAGAKWGVLEAQAAREQRRVAIEVELLEVVVRLRRLEHEVAHRGFPEREVRRLRHGGRQQDQSRPTARGRPVRTLDQGVTSVDHA